MALDSKAPPIEDQEELQRELIDHDALGRHPSAPTDELFDISTTVDPSYVISLIRKLLPPSSSEHHSHGHAVDAPVQGSDIDPMAQSDPTPSGDVCTHSSTDRSERMKIINGFDKNALEEGENGDPYGGAAQHRHGVAVGEETWEEHGCILWDLAASRTHAELMVQNFILEVLLANLMVSQSARATEITLGIIGNLACHEFPLKHIVTTNGLVGGIVEQLFSDDAQCLSEACRLLTVGLHSCERVTWAKALESEHNLRRILWIAENSLNLQLIEKSVELLLATMENSEEVAHILLPPLMTLGLASVLINLLGFEMSKLRSERVPERYPILDVILRCIEALSVIDDYSQQICSNKELFQLVCDLVKLPDKVEVENSCVTATILIANILSDIANLASEISQDMLFLQGLLDIFPFTSDDLEARSALWNIIARLMLRVKEDEMSPSALQQYVLVLVGKSDVIEDDLLDFQLDGLQSAARTTALKRIGSILKQWKFSKDNAEENNMMGDHADDMDIDRLLSFCLKHSEDVPSRVSQGIDLKE